MIFVAHHFSSFFGFIMDLNFQNCFAEEEIEYYLNVIMSRCNNWGDEISLYWVHYKQQDNSYCSSLCTSESGKLQIVSIYPA